MQNKKLSVKKSLKHKTGDVIERMGEKLKDMGAVKAGNAVYKAGNKLEHSYEKVGKKAVR